MSATPRRIAVLLPTATGENHLPLLQAAAELAGPQGHLDVLALQAEGNDPQPPLLAAPTLWWDIAHAQLERFDAPRLLPLFAEALQRHVGITSQTPALVLLPAGPLGEECAAGLAARLGGQSLGRCTTLAMNGAALQARRPAYGGRVELSLHSEATLCLATWRPATPTHGAAIHRPQRRPLRLDTALPAPAMARTLESADRMPALEGAPLVVSGGRGMAGEDGFALLAQIAQQLGAALGGSLPTVDAGWVPVARQIGQSGKFVTPRCYFAVGISGTPQHMAGVSGESHIIAINKDAAAPIFERAELGVVADWQALLPALLQTLQQSD